MPSSYSLEDMTAGRLDRLATLKDTLITAVGQSFADRKFPSTASCLTLKGKLLESLLQDEPGRSAPGRGLDQQMVDLLLRDLTGCVLSSTEA